VKNKDFLIDNMCAGTIWPPCLFQAIGKAVNAPSRVLLARSRSRQEDGEGFQQCSAWFWADYIFLLLVTGQGPNMGRRPFVGRHATRIRTRTSETNQV